MEIVPEAYRDLVSDTSKAIAYLATTMPDGSPIISPVWFGSEGEHIVIFTGGNSLKTRNMKDRPQVAIILQDPDNQYRYIQLRGKMVAATPTEDKAFLDKLSRRYIGTDYPDDGGTDNVLVKIKPEKVNVFDWG